jgi:ADP-ribose pyrophosphatase YjhB (NUDIX family)
MKHATQNDYFASLPKKITGAGVIFLNTAGQIMLVEPSYKNYWDIPGGVVNDLESPKAAAQREVWEEIGIAITLGRLLCIDYKYNSEQWDAYQMLFYGGMLSDDDIKKIKVDGKEIISYRFVDKETAFSLVSHAKVNRIEMALQALAKGETYYLEHGILC